MKQKMSLSQLQIVAISLSILSLGLAIAWGGFFYFSAKKQAQKSCPLDAKICPDGSRVHRVGLKCEFAPCPRP